MAAIRRPTKNEKRRNKKKENIEPKSEGNKINDTFNGANTKNTNDNDSFDGIEVEYVSADYNEDLGIDSSVLDQFRSVFEKFAKPEELFHDAAQETESSTESSRELVEHHESNSSTIAEDNSEAQTLSKRKKKLLTRLSVAELKQLVHRPDVVEAHDVTSLDPRLLVTLKSYRNSVPVPRHWCHIRKYLTGKVGMEKPPFQLPEFIAETGIAKIRDAVMEQEAAKKSKAKARERIRPKMGKIDIDYQVLHDAFFKYQTKPKLTNHGDLYYEGKEYEVSMKEMKPGHMSPELIAALGIADGAPPPWLINMQRYGPPPSYPTMKIPGLSAPLPPGASYGYQPGGWGKPPVDEYGRPLYGDVFGEAEDTGVVHTDVAVDKTFRWGELQAPEYETDEEEDDEGEERPGEDEDDRGVYDPSGAETPSTLDGTNSVTMSGISGLETPDTVDLRKRAGMETPDSTYTSTAGAGRELYHVIQEKQNAGAAVGQMFGSDRVYVLPNGGGNGKNVGTGVGIGGEQYTNNNNSNNNGTQSSTIATTHEDEDGEEDRASGARKKRKMDATATKLKEFKF